MNMPTDGSTLTQDQINLAINIVQFPGATPGTKNWHFGQFEPWAQKFGYSDGMPIYADVLVGGNSYHIYFLNDGHQCPIILRLGEDPSTYGVVPQ